MQWLATIHPPKVAHNKPREAKPVLMYTPGMPGTGPMAGKRSCQTERTAQR